MAPAQYIAISTASGFIAIGDDGRCATFDMRERLDFFKLLSPPDSRETSLFCSAGLRRCFLRPVSETGCRINTAAGIFKLQVA
ncbi:MAG TPA: hypothetical protein VGI93_24830 [Steroidobacteraceae bacterium]